MNQIRRWRRTQSLDHHWKLVHTDDWTLVGEGSDFLGRIHDTGENNLLGSWRWWVQPFYKVENVGSAQTGAEARKIVEERLAARAVPVHISAASRAFAPVEEGQNRPNCPTDQIKKIISQKED